MKDLNAAERVELEQLVTEFCQDRRLDGLDCYLILVGRGLEVVAYPEDAAPEAPGVLAWPASTAMKRNARTAN